MKVFISWSGERSKTIALALREWLPEVIQALTPWMSDEDIDKGTRWSPKIAGELEQIKAGIICVTPENVTSPWLNFESGALAKTVTDTFVCPFVLGMTKTQLTGPLSQFQITVADEADTQKLIMTLNSATPSPLPAEKIRRTFDKWWPDLAMKLKAIAPAPTGAKTRRSQEDMIEEVLGIVRTLRDRGARNAFEAEDDIAKQFRRANQAKVFELVRDVVRDGISKGLKDRDVQEIWNQVMTEDPILQVAFAQQLIARRLTEKSVPTLTVPTTPTEDGRTKGGIDG
jgi:hypothetical protein